MSSAQVGGERGATASGERGATEGGLRRNQLGFPEVLFQALASAAPGLGVTLAVIVGANFAGASLGLSLILALVGILLVATCVGQMAQHFPSAGGFYTFVAHGLHPAMGTLVAWLYLLIWIVFPSTLFLPFGAFVATTLNDWFGWSETAVWIVAALLCIVLIHQLVISGARFSTKAGIVLGMSEFIILGLLAVWLIAEAGDRNTLSVFTPEYAEVEGFAGTAGILGGTVFAIYGFVGFENVVPLAEEAKEPRRSVRRAAVLAPLILGLFIIFCTYAATVYFGPDRFVEFPASNGGDAWIGITKDVWGGGWYVLLLALLNSCVASANGATNAGIRHAFAMARINLLPSRLAHVHERTGVPSTALAVLMAISVVATLAAGLLTDGPLAGFAFLGTIEVALAILLYGLVAVACASWFLRTRPRGFNPLLHVVVPVLAVAVMVPALMTAVGIGEGIFPFISPLPSPLNIAGYIALGWFVAGLAWVAWLWTAHRDRVQATERIFVESGA